MRDALSVVRRKVLNVISNLAKFAEEYRSMPALAYTHLQPAQLTTVGKRATLWINELMMDLEEIDYRIASCLLYTSAEIYDEMTKRGWYKTEPAEQQKINQAKTKFTAMNA